MNRRELLERRRQLREELAEVNRLLKHRDPAPAPRTVQWFVETWPGDVATLEQVVRAVGLKDRKALAIALREAGAKVCRMNVGVANYARSPLVVLRDGPAIVDHAGACEEAEKLFKAIQC